MTRRVRAAPLALLLFGLGGCGGTLATTAAGRIEHPASAVASPGPAVQTSPSLAWRTRLGRSLVETSYAPTLLLGPQASPLLRHRADAATNPSGTSGLRPFTRLSAEYGAVRTSEPADPETLEALPVGEVLRSYSVGGEAGVKGHLDRRTQLALHAGADRSAGIGSSSGAFPELTRLELGARASRQRTRAQTIEGSAQVTRYSMGRATWLLTTDARATFTLAKGVSLSTRLGGAASVNGPGSGSGPLRPVAGLAVNYTVPGRQRTAVSLSLETSPRFDRLDGGLRQRLAGRAWMDVGVLRKIRLTAFVNWSQDLSGEGLLRRLVTANATLTAPLRSDWDFLLGAHGSLQATDGNSDRSDSRIHLGFSKGWTLR